MSLIDTIGPVILLALLGVAVVVFAIGLTTKMLAQAAADRAEREVAQHLVDQNKIAQQIIAELIVCLDSDSLASDVLPKDFQERAWRLHESFNNPRRELK